MGRGLTYEVDIQATPTEELEVSCDLVFLEAIECIFSCIDIATCASLYNVDLVQQDIAPIILLQKSVRCQLLHCYYLILLSYYHRIIIGLVMIL